MTQCSYPSELKTEKIGTRQLDFCGIVPQIRAIYAKNGDRQFFIQHFDPPIEKLEEFVDETYVVPKFCYLAKNFSKILAGK